MKRWLMWTSLVLTLGLLAGGAAYATGGTAHATDTRGKRLTIRFLDVAVPEKSDFVDIGEAGSSPGDMFVFENELRNRADTKTLGRFAGVCTNLVSPGLVSCRGTLELARGTIEVAALVDFAAGGPIVAAVTGGTERFKTAHGQMRLSEEVASGVRKGTLQLRL
jgi:hypothetical protein